ncbi:MAG: integrin alpha, partial [Myxococcota bacterium]
AGGGDLDGDGWDDVATGAPGAGATDEGAVYLVDGPVYGTLDLATADATVTGAAAYDGAGEALALGDVDGDGFDDLIVGGPAAGGGAGVVWVLRGPVGGTTSVASADATWTGGAIPDAAGTSVSAGDVDGDGRADLVAGAPGAGAGETYVALDALAGGAFSGADLVASGEVTGDAAGTAVDALGDLDRDGLADVIIGAPEADTTERGAGAVYVIYAFAPGALLLDAAGARVEGEDMHGGAGVSAASAPDVDGDTYDDLVLGASGDDEGGSGAGAAYLLLGGGF